jgi:hypothetical protein
MIYEEVKRKIATRDLDPPGMFGVLREISQLLNNRETYNDGRDLVIRALSCRDLCDDFEQQVLVSLVRLVGLYPYMKDSLHYADLNDRIAYELHRPENLEEVLNSLQARIYHQIKRGRNVVLSASTSVGKSLIIDAAIASGKYRKIVIVVPTLALIDETRKRLSRRFGEKYNIVTHPSQECRRDIPNILILTQERVRLRSDLRDVDFFVVDEFYKIDLKNVEDVERAIDLNLAFHELAKNGSQFYMLGPNVHAVTGLDRYDIYFVPANYTTVAVDVVHFNLPTRGEDRLNKLSELCKGFSTPTLIYCQSISSASKVAIGLLRQLKDYLPITCSEECDWIATNFHKEWIVVKALRRGIGIHHGGLSRSLQQFMVRLFNDGIIKFLICTSTLIEGVNTAAENVVIFDRRKGNDPLDFFTYKNIQGRAGRMGRYFIGRVFVLEKPLEEDNTYIDYVIDSQGLDTPLPLLLQLENSDLTGLSREIVADALRNRFLSVETLRSNPGVHPEIQDRIAREIQDALLIDPRLFAWSGIPKKHQLLAICDLIYNHISKPALNRARIWSAAQLHWHLRRATTREGIPGYLRDVVSGLLPGQDISEKIDDALRILRNITTYRFPREMMIIWRIQAEVAERMGLTPGSYVSYAENLENLFMPGVLAALDEYGVPIQIVSKIKNVIGIHHELGAVLQRMRTVDVEELSVLTSFEKKWLARVQESL